MPPYKFIIEIITVLILLAILIVMIIYDFKFLRELSDDVSKAEANV